MNTRRTQDTWLYAVALVAVLAVVAVIGVDAYLDQRDRTVHADGVATGYQTAIDLNVPTTQHCMAFWFNGDKDRVAKVIQQIKSGKVAPL